MCRRGWGRGSWVGSGSLGREGVGRECGMLPWGMVGRRRWV